ncbi:MULTISPECIES: ligase-associated DNA damage response exonuclease [unclassified Haematobacter]|uniref:ligase-associated DNA damage response exonuclease n=1 Tax=unclassified Haematobacter TaxID=2640585 RepID=UPI0025BF030B|nr:MULTISPECIES: ligase-associated DNA damage response exonuclease [unclassified Haematobacter]
MRGNSLLTFTDAGIFCPEGGFHIDPWRPVDRAVITHAHSDHARVGSNRYLATPLTAPILRYRLGDVRVEVLPYGERRQVGGVTLSFHPAGHVPGSAQVRIERDGEVWVVSGDYKTEPDGLSEPFEPVPCDTFISECTFGLPIFSWQPQAEIMGAVNDWWKANAAAGRFSVIGAYSLGKAQRILASVDNGIGPLLTHGAIEGTTEALRAAGVSLPDTVRVTPETDLRALPGGLVVAPPSALASPWVRRFGAAETALASGWMALRGVRRNRGVQRGFVLSDHADWAGLNSAIRATGAERVFVTHGYTQPFRRWLAEQGFDAAIVETRYEGDEAGDEVVE